MNNRIFASVICCMLIVSTVVNAKINVEIDNDKNAVIINGTSEEDDVLVTMLKAGTTIEEFYSALTTGNTPLENIISYYRQLETKNSEYSATVIMPETAGKGEYLLMAGDEKQIVSYSPLSYRLGLIESFMLAESGNDIREIINNNEKYIGFWDMYETVSNKTLVSDIVYERIGEFELTAGEIESWETIVKIINNAILVSALNDSLINDFDTVKKMIYKDTAIENMYSLTESMTDEGVKLILSNCSHRNFKGYSEFKKALTEQLALQAFNCWGEIDSEDLIDILNTYGDVLGLSLSSFSLLSHANQAECVRKLSAEKCSLDILNTRLQEIVASLNTVKVPEITGISSTSRSKGKGNTVVLSDNSVTDKVPPEQATLEEFSDMDNYEWANEAVNSMKSKGIITGYGDGTFRPAEHVTRSEIVAMTVKLLYSVSNIDKTVFDDVPSDYWGYKYIMTAYEKGIVKGISDRRFMPDAEISREDMAVILSNILNNSENSSEGKKFIDDEEISDYAYNSVYYLKSLGVILGNSDGKFMPKNAASRAEAAQMLYNLINKRNGVATFAATPEISETNTNKYEDKYNLLAELGVVDNTFEYNYNGMVKRDVFTQMVINAMKYSDLSTASGNVYADVPITNEHAAAIETLAAIRGEDTGKTLYFYPHNNITLEEALELIFDVTQYSHFVEAIGENGILTLANTKSMLKKVSCAWDDEISGSDALILIFNMLNLNPVEVTANKTYSEDKSTTLLKKIHEVYDESGIICANSLTTFYAESELQENKIMLDTNGKYFEMDCGTTATEDYLGMFTKLYYKYGNEDDAPVILYADINNTKNVMNNINLDDVGSLSADKISYFEEENDRTLLFSPSIVYIYNDTYYTGNIITDKTLTDKVGDIIVIDNNNDGRYDVIKITAFDTYVVNNVTLNDEVIYDKYNPSVAININKDNYERYSLKFADGREAKPEDMRDGIVISVAKNADGCSMHAINIIISDKKIGGVITEYVNDNSRPIVTLDYNTEYNVLKNAEKSISSVGNGILAYLDAFSNIAYIDASNSGGYSFGLVLKTAKDKGLSGIVKMEIYSQDNKMHVYELDNSVTIDGNKYNDADKIIVAIASIGQLTIDGKELPNGCFPVRYLTNAYNKIIKIDTAEMGNGEADDKLITMENGKYNYTSDGCLGYTIPVNVSSRVLKIVLPNNYTITDVENENNLNFTTASSAFKKGSTYGVAAFKCDSKSHFPELLMTIGGYGFNYTDPLMMISSISEAYDDESQTTVPYVKGIKEGNEVSIKVSERFAEEFNSRNFVVGDVIRYISNNQGKMIVIDGSPAVVKYNLNDKKIMLGNIDQGATNDLNSMKTTDKSAHLMYGYAKFRQEGLLQIAYITYGNGSEKSIRPDNIDWDSNLIYVNISASVPVTVFDSSQRTGKQVYSGTYDDIKDYSHNGNEYSRVLLKYRSSELKEVIVFNDSSLAE